MSDSHKIQQFKAQGLTDFRKGKAPRWTDKHPYYDAYITGYQTGAAIQREADRKWRREHGLFARIKKVVAAWLKH